MPPKPFSLTLLYVEMEKFNYRYQKTQTETCSQLGTLGSNRVNGPQAQTFFGALLEYSLPQYGYHVFDLSRSIIPVALLFAMSLALFSLCLNSIYLVDKK